MYRGEKKEHSKGGVSHQSEVAKLLTLLEQNDMHVVEEIKMLIHEQLSQTKEAWLLHGLVDCYMATQSPRCLEIIVGVREPHDKHLFDKLAEFLRGMQRYPALLLLGHLVRRHPSWLHKIAQHRIMYTLLNVLKTDKIMPNLMSAVLIIAALLPAIPSLIGSYLPDIFEVFSRLAAWNAKKPGNMPAVYILHLQTAVYALFHRLYAMYPCNFLAYLRSYYGRRDQSQESFIVFTETIKPMLERVRLHPLLVTASKETELTTTRWKKMEIHDIIVECAKVSLDVIEGTREDVPYSDLWSSKPLQITSGRHDFLFLKSPKENSSSPLTSVNPKGAIKESSLKCQTSDSGSLWSPSLACGLNIPSTDQSSLVSDTTDTTYSDKGQVTTTSSPKVGESPPLDVAVEAKPEESSEVSTLVIQEPPVSTEQEDICDNLDVHNGVVSLEDENINEEVHYLENSQSEEISPLDNNSKSSLPDVSQAEEAREEEITDKEVSEIVSNSKVSYVSGEDVGHDTPFFSTTQKLTDDPQTPYDLSLSDTAQTSSQSQEEELETSSKDCQMMENFVHRLRYFSYCGPPPPEISIECKPKHSILKRFNSCPDILTEKNSVEHNLEDGQQMDSSCVAEQQTIVGSQSHSSSYLQSVNNFPVNTSNIETAFSFVPVQNALNTVVHLQTTSQNTNASLISPAYSHLFPLALQPQPVPHSVFPMDFRNTVSPLKPTPIPSHFSDSSASSCYGDIPFYTTVSPPELLDRHLQLGNEIYMKELNVPLTSTRNTDWTHFGGHAPADEVDILHGQILLLHNQLLFERHKREIHAERNRRLLGKAKFAWALEEQNGAMKDQVLLQEKKIQELGLEVNNLIKMCQKLQEAKHHQHDHVMEQIRLLTMENTALKEEITKINEQLIQHRQEKDVLRSELRKVHSHLSETKLELEAASHHVTKCQRLEDDSKRLAKEVLLLSEMNQHYKERIENLQNHPESSAEVSLMRDSANSEISALQQKLEIQTSLLEASKSRITQLEDSIENINLIVSQQKQLLEMTKGCHTDVLQAKEERISTLKKVCQQQVVHILDLGEKLKLAEFGNISASLHKTKQIMPNVCSIKSSCEIRPDDSAAAVSAIDGSTFTSPTSNLIDSTTFPVPGSNDCIDSSKTIMQDACAVTRPTSLSRLSQQHLTYQNLENCVNDFPENNTLQSRPFSANSNGCTPDTN